MFIYVYICLYIYIYIYGEKIFFTNRKPPKRGENGGKWLWRSNFFSKKAIKGINRQQKLRAIQIRGLLVIKLTKMSIILNIDFIIFWHKLTEKSDTGNYFGVKKLLKESSLAWRVAIGWTSLQWLRSLSSMCLKEPLWDTPCDWHSNCTSRYFPAQKLCLVTFARSSCDHIALILQSSSLGRFGPGLLFGFAKARVKADIGAASTLELSLCKVECKVRLLALSSVFFGI